MVCLFEQADSPISQYGHQPEHLAILNRWFYQKFGLPNLVLAERSSQSSEAASPLERLRSVYGVRVAI